MSKKKNKAEPLEPKDALEAKVDAMMDVERSDPGPEPQVESLPTDDKSVALPPLDIFKDAKTAPALPVHMLKEVDATEEPEPEPAPMPEEPEPTESAPSQAELDDPTTDAAVDDIVAHESDTVLATEDAEAEAAAARSEPAERAKHTHHHPIFWTLMTLIAILAVLLAVLLASGGNLSFPGSERVQSLWHAATRHF